MSHFGKCNFRFLKNSQVQINSKLNEKKTILINNVNMKTFGDFGGSAKRYFLKSFSLIWENFLQSFCPKFLSSFYAISLAYKYFCRLSANHYPEL